MLYFLQQQLNTWPADYSARNQLSSTGRFLSPFADQLEDSYLELVKLYKDIGVLQPIVNKIYQLNWWDISSFPFITNGSYMEIPTILGDGLYLERIEWEDISRVYPIRISLEKTLTNFEPLIGSLNIENTSIEDVIIEYPTKIIFFNSLFENTMQIPNSPLIGTYLEIKGMNIVGELCEEMIIVKDYIKETVHEYSYIEYIKIYNVFTDNGDVKVSVSYSSNSDAYWKWPFLDKTNKVLFCKPTVSNESEITFRYYDIQNTDSVFLEDYLPFKLLDSEGDEISISSLTYDDNKFLYVASGPHIFVYDMHNWRPDFPTQNKTIFSKTKITSNKEYYTQGNEAYIEITPAIDSDVYTSLAIKIIDPENNVSWLQSDYSFAEGKFEFLETEIFFKIPILSNGTYTIESYAYYTLNNEKKEFINNHYIIAPQIFPKNTLSIDDTISEIFIIKDRLFVNTYTESRIYKMLYDYFIFDQDSKSIFTLNDYEEIDVQYI